MAPGLNSDAGKDATAAGLRNALVRLAGAQAGCCVIPVRSGHPLFREEEAFVADAVETRRREFATGRACARTALAELGCPPSPILRGPFYEPVWPRGFGGSITHDDTYAAAIAYRTNAAGHLGIDLLAPSDVSLLMETSSTFVTSSEATRLRPADPRAIGMIFSAKEAAIKIVTVRRQAFTDFQEIESHPTDGGMMLHIAGVPSPIVATFAEFEGFLVTLAIAQDPAERTPPDSVERPALGPVSLPE
jgi:4'-phosphopantetheinyl transferase EntD